MNQTAKTLAGGALCLTLLFTGTVAFAASEAKTPMQSLSEVTGMTQQQVLSQRKVGKSCRAIASDCGVLAAFEEKVAQNPMTKAERQAACTVPAQDRPQNGTGIGVCEGTGNEDGICNGGGLCNGTGTGGGLCNGTGIGNGNATGAGRGNGVSDGGSVRGGGRGRGQGGKGLGGGACRG